MSATRHLLQAPVAIWLFYHATIIELFHGDCTRLAFLFLLLCGMWELLVWGLIGGAITRIAALKFTRDEAPGPVAALKHAAASCRPTACRRWSRWLARLCSPSSWSCSAAHAARFLRVPGRHLSGRLC